MKLLINIPDSGEQNGFLTAETKAYLESEMDVVYNESSRQLKEAEYAELIRGCDVVMTGWGSPPLTEAVLRQGTPKLLAHVGGTVADYMTDAAYEAGVRVLSGNAHFAESVAEGTLAYMLSALRSIPTEVSALRSGEWRPEYFRKTEGLLDQTVGIIGFGTISRYLIEMLRPFRVKLKIYSSYKIDEEYLSAHGAEQAEIDEIFASCKIVSLHSALNEKTRGMIRGRHLDLMADGSIFINTARGAIVAESEMAEVLSRRDIRAFLDVFTEEPLPVESPLRSLPNVYLAPHHAGPTEDRRPFIGRAVAEDVVRFVHGEPLTLEIPYHRAKTMTKH